MTIDRGRKVPVIDWTRALPAIRIEVAYAEAAELLLSTWVLATPSQFDYFELGRTRLEQLRGRASDSLLDAVDELALGSGGAASLLGLVRSLGAPFSAERLIAAIDDTDPLEIQLYLLGYHMRGHHLVAPERIVEAAQGDAAAARDLIRAAADWDGKPNEITRFLELGAPRIKELLLALLPAWYKNVFVAIGDEGRALCERTALETAATGEMLTADQLIDAIAPGLHYSFGPDVRELVAFPSYSARPWVTLTEHHDARIVCFPATESAAETARRDAETLARVYKALGDQNRLRLLRMLRQRTVTVSEAATALGIAKSTAHHHFALLRHAGLITISDDDVTSSYTIRPDAETRIAALLNSFLNE